MQSLFLNLPGILNDQIVNFNFGNTIGVVGSRDKVFFYIFFLFALFFISFCELTSFGSFFLVDFLLLFYIKLKLLDHEVIQIIWAFYSHEIQIIETITYDFQLQRTLLLI